MKYIYSSIGIILIVVGLTMKFNKSNSEYIFTSIKPALENSIDTLNEALKSKDGQARYFAPRFYAEYFQRYHDIIIELKKMDRVTFSHIQIKEIPEPDESIVIEGEHGFYLRPQIKKLKVDIDHVLKIINSKYSYHKDKNNNKSKSLLLKLLNWLVVTGSGLLILTFGFFKKLIILKTSLKAEVAIATTSIHNIYGKLILRNPTPFKIDFIDNVTIYTKEEITEIKTDDVQLQKNELSNEDRNINKLAEDYRYSYKIDKDISIEHKGIQTINLCLSTNIDKEEHKVDKDNKIDYELCIILKITSSYFGRKLLIKSKALLSAEPYKEMLEDMEKRPNLESYDAEW